MDNPPELPSLIEHLKEYKEAAAIIGGAFLMLFAFVKKVRTPVVFIANYIFAFIMVPMTLQHLKEDSAQLKADNIMPDGAKVKDRLIDLSRWYVSTVRWRRAVVDALDSPTFEADKDGNFIWANEALLSLVDLDISEIEGKNWKNIIAGPERYKIIRGWEDAVKDCSDYRVTFKLDTKEGEHWAVFSATCNKDDRGHVIDFVGKIRLISDPNTAERASGHTTDH